MTANNRRMYVLIFGAVLSAIIAAFMTFSDALAPKPAMKVFPDLKLKKADIIAVNIDYKNSVITLISDNIGGWYVGEMDGYPALKARVETLFTDLENLELAEIKTSDAAKYPELWVNDVNQEGAQGKRISLVGKDGNIIANLTVGKTEGDKIFIRKNNDAQVWLAKGKLDISGNITSWVEEPLFPVTANQIRKITLTDVAVQPEEELIFTRETAEVPFSFTYK